MERLIEFEATQPDERLLEAKRRSAANPEVFERNLPKLEVPPGLLGWIQHVAWLAGLVDAGCTLGLDDLAPEEWDGLRLWRSAEERFRARYVSCPGCGTAIKRQQKGHFCGWRAES